MGALWSDHGHWDGSYFYTNHPDSPCNRSSYHLCNDLLDLLSEVQIHYSVTNGSCFSIYCGRCGLFRSRAFDTWKSGDVHGYLRNLDSVRFDFPFDLPFRSLYRVAIQLLIRKQVIERRARPAFVSAILASFSSELCARIMGADKENPFLPCFHFHSPTLSLPYCSPFYANGHCNLYPFFSCRGYIRPIFNTKPIPSSPTNPYEHEHGGDLNQYPHHRGQGST